MTLPIPAPQSNEEPGFNCFDKIKPFNNSQEHLTSGKCEFSKPPNTEINVGSFEAQCFSLFLYQSSFVFSSFILFLFSSLFSFSFLSFVSFKNS